MLTINLKSLQLFADSSSHGGGGGGSSMHQQQTPSTPSGVTVDQFRAMSDQEQVDTVNRILADPNIVVPAYLDGSETSKVMYALGMNNQMTVVSEDQLNQMSGRELFRTVYDAPNGMTAGDILNQVKSGEYTQLSGAGGSAHGRALYFATNFGESASYGVRGDNSTVMHAKLNSNAKLIDESTLRSQVRNNSTYRYQLKASNKDDLAIYAIAKGYDGWYSGSYTMMINRGVMTASSTNKRAVKKGTSKRTKDTNWSNMASSWDDAAPT